MRILRAFDAREKRSKTREISPGGMPIPKSRTTTVTRLVAARHPSPVDPVPSACT